MVKLPDCKCNASKEIQDHNQMLKLMQFLMRLDNSYKQIRSILLTSDPLPTIKNAYVILSREESHKTSSNSMTNKSQAYAFNSKTASNPHVLLNKNSNFRNNKDKM